MHTGHLQFESSGPSIIDYKTKVNESASSFMKEGRHIAKIQPLNGDALQTITCRI